MSQHRWALLIGLGIVFLLISLPQILIMSEQLSDATPAHDATPRPRPTEPADKLHPIAEPPPRTGLPPYLIWWNLLSSGLSLGIALGIGGFPGWCRRSRSRPACR